MQIVSLDLNHFDFFCPVTGTRILGAGEGFIPSAAAKGSWYSEIIEEPEICDSKLRSLWDSYVEKQDQDDEFYDANEFFTAINEPTWVAFEITTSGMACGPVSSTAWVVIDMDAAEAE